MKSTALCVVFVAALTLAPAAADDLFPPVYRGQPLSVEAHWDFNALPNFTTGEPPDSFNAVGGSNGETLYNGFQTHIDFDGSWGWDGVSSIVPQTPASQLGVNMQNWVDDELFKSIRIQISYTGPAPIILPGVIGQELAGTPDEYDVFGTLAAHVDIDPFTFYEDWVMVPNPDWEQIPIQAGIGTKIDQIDVDTISFPEPTSLILVALGAAFTLRRR